LAAEERCNNTRHTALAVTGSKLPCNRSFPERVTILSFTMASGRGRPDHQPVADFVLKAFQNCTQLATRRARCHCRHLSSVNSMAAGAGDAQQGVTVRGLPAVSALSRL
jgi:hypothetical protein